MAFKMNIKVPKKLQLRVREKIERIIQDDEILDEVGEIARKDAVAHILQAKNPATDQKFKPISKEWQKRKRRLSTVNTPIDARAGGATRAARLAFTGGFLKSFTHRIVRGYRNRKIVEIGPTGNRSPYRNLNGSRSKGGAKTNQELGKYLIEQGRDWRGVPTRVHKRINTAVRRFIRRKLRSSNS